MDKEISPILITGAAGFIGAAVCKKLLANKHHVIGIDDLNNYYSKELKLKRIKNIYEDFDKLKNNWNFIEVY